MNPAEEHILMQKEPFQSIMLHIRSVIFNTLPQVNERYSYGIPFYNIGKKPLLYLNVLKGTDFVDVAFVQGVLLEEEFPILKDYNKRKQVRSVQLKSLEDLDQIQFTALLKEAARRLEISNKPWFIN